MRNTDIRAVARIWALGFLAFAMWFVCLWGSEPRRPAAVSPTGKEFSVENAEHVLARVLAPERPHPVSSVENAHVRAPTGKEFTALGIRARSYSAFTCTQGFAFMNCATVTDTIMDVTPGRGEATR